MKLLASRLRLGTFALAVTTVAAGCLPVIPVTLRPQASNVEVGARRDVSVKADLSSGDPKVANNYFVEVDYDSTVVRAVACRPRVPESTCDTSSPGSVTMSYSGSEISGEVMLAVITFSGVRLGRTTLEGSGLFYSGDGGLFDARDFASGRVPAEAIGGFFPAVVTPGSITVVPPSNEEEDSEEPAQATETPVPAPTATSTPIPTATPTPPTIRGATSYRGGSLLMCDWDGDGVRTPGRVNGNTWRIRNSDSDAAPETVFTFGEPGDTPVCGDWDGNGTETPGMVRGNVWYLRNSVTTGVADLSFAYGNEGDIAVVGDWDGDGIDSPGVFRAGAWYLRDTNLPDQGDRGIAVVFGHAGDIPTPADWDANRTDTVGYVRDRAFYIRNSNTSGEPERVIPVPTVP